MPLSSEKCTNLLSSFSGSDFFTSLSEVVLSYRHWWYN